MKPLMIFTFLLSLILAGCSGEHPSVQVQTTTNDTLKGSGSIDQATVLASENALTYEERQGKFLYERYCMVCHGQEGKGDGFNAFNLDPKPRDFSDSLYMNALGDKQALQTISGGGRSVNKSPLMPSYGWTMKKEEIEYVEAYVRTFSSRK
jgi:cytochrome c oxidase cbb3-type subunit III